MSDMPELKPCPFCGAGVERITYGIICELQDYPLGLIVVGK